MGSGWEYGLCLYGRVNGEPCVLRGDRTRGVGRPLWGYWAGSPVNVCWGLGELIRVCGVLGGGPEAGAGHGWWRAASGLFCVILQLVAQLEITMFMRSNRPSLYLW